VKLVLQGAIFLTAKALPQRLAVVFKETLEIMVRVRGYDFGAAMELIGSSRAEN